MLQEPKNKFEILLTESKKKQKKTTKKRKKEKEKIGTEHYSVCWRVARRFMNCDINTRVNEICQGSSLVDPKS